MEQSYFQARCAEGQVQTKGLLSCSLGHRIELGGERKADGIFAHWNWDGSRLTAGNDRYGFFPLFYYCRDGEFAISSSIPRLIEVGAPTDLDEAALAVFLRLGFFIGDDTPYKHIRTLPPDAALAWDGRLKVHSPGHAFADAHGPIGRDDAIDTYIGLFRQAIERRLPQAEDFIVPLSGGRDSRHILLELLHQGYRPERCLTTLHYPPRSNEDARIAQALARELGLPHTLLKQSESRFKAEYRKNVLTNFCSDEHAWYMVAADYLVRRALPVYDGIGGDVLSAGLFLTPHRLGLFESGSCRTIAEELLAADEELFARLLPRAVMGKMGRELAIAHLESELTHHLRQPNPVGSFFFWNRTRREIALVPYGLLSALPTVFSPYLDHDLYGFLAGLPAHLLADHAFHTDTIARAYPKYADLPYEDKCILPLDAFDCDAAFGNELARQLMLKQRSHLMRNSFLRPRLFASLLSRRFSASTNWYSAVALYLHQLESPLPVN
jgi:asparagine synthase (glutamine-hydrolysing)